MNDVEMDHWTLKILIHCIENNEGTSLYAYVPMCLSWISRAGSYQGVVHWRADAGLLLLLYPTITLD